MGEELFPSERSQVKHIESDTQKAPESLVDWEVLMHTHLIVRTWHQEITTCYCLWSMILLVKNSSHKKPVTAFCQSVQGFLSVCHYKITFMFYFIKVIHTSY